MFQSEQFIRYMKYTMMQSGLNGLFIQKNVEEIENGYTDQLIEDLQSIPLYRGGGSTRDQNVTVLINTYDNQVGFLEGGENKTNSLLTRQYTKW